jgi:hypothetical protein
MFRQFFCDKNGTLVTFQSPNAPLILFVICSIIVYALPDFYPSLFECLRFGAIFTWAWLELFYGVTPARRVLGAIIMIASLLPKI